MSSNVYSFFDDIICINLDSRRDRREYAESVFIKYNIPARFLTVTKHPQGGVYGCFDSHMQIVLDAYNQDKDYILVFEDDILPTETYSELHIINAINFMKTEKKWDVFYLGYMVFNYDISHPFLGASKIDGYKHIIQYNPFATHAMVYSKRAIKKILAVYQNYIGKMHYDIFLSSKPGLVNYCYTPMLFDQKFCFASDIESRNMLEYSARGMQCFADKNRILYRISAFKDVMDAYTILFRTIFITTLIVAILIAYYSIRRKLKKA
jgi:glycosyl transferase family 25